MQEPRHPCHDPIQPVCHHRLPSSSSSIPLLFSLTPPPIPTTPLLANSSPPLLIIEQPQIGRGPTVRPSFLLLFFTPPSVRAPASTQLSLSPLARHSNYSDGSPFGARHPSSIVSPARLISFSLPLSPLSPTPVPPVTSSKPPSPLHRIERTEGSSSSESTTTHCQRPLSRSSSFRTSRLWIIRYPHRCCFGSSSLDRCQAMIVLLSAFVS